MKIRTEFLIQCKRRFGHLCGFKTPPGFTLIELLLSMTIIMLVGSVMLVVFFTTIRGRERAQRQIVLRQNGDFALSQLSRAMRQAESATCAANGTSVTVTSPVDRQDTTYVCSGTGDTAILASQSATGTVIPLIDNTAVSTSACSFSCSMQPATQLPLVTVSFSLVPKGMVVTKADTPRLDFQAAIEVENAGN